MSTTVQQVNLYLPELRPTRDWLTGMRLLQAIVLMLVLMVVFAAWKTWQRGSLQEELAVTQASLQEQTRRTEQLERELAGRATDPSLLREMNTLELGVTQSRELFEFMSTTTLGNLRGYSVHMKDLSRASFPGLWLTEFNIRGDASYVRIRGGAQQAAMLPDFVGRLSAGESEIRHQSFSRLLSTRGQSVDNNVVHEFVLETNP